tara:strand:+ start:1985 stop:2362 length:378 start_codon:yes stop_codon:yes gene_type:complete
MQAKNNNITVEQWNQLMEAVDRHIDEAKCWPADVLYRGSKQNTYNKRLYCYDNYDRLDHPGLDLRIDNGETFGELTVYNASEQARAPITFEEGLQIARNFFNEYGGQMAEEIVCEWVMDGNSSIF